MPAASLLGRHGVPDPDLRHRLGPPHAAETPSRRSMPRVEDPTRHGHSDAAGEAPVIGILKVALRRPYTFIVMALLILIFAVASALRPPTPPFPHIHLPAVTVS